MKKWCKKILIVQTIFIIIFTFILLSRITLYGSTLTDEDLYYENCNNSIKIYDEAIEPFISSIRTINEDDNLQFNNNYAGSFIDNNGILNIGYLQYSDKFLSSETVHYIKKEFSYNYLLEIKNTISTIMIEYDINMVGIDDEGNDVDVFVTDLNIANNLIAYLQDKNLYNPNAIDIKIDQGNQINLTSKAAYGGDKINDSFLFLPRTVGTICVNAYDNDTGKFGVLTNAHVADANITMYHDGKTSNDYKIGTATKRQNTGTIDAAFIPFESQNDWYATTAARSGDTIYNDIQLGDKNLIIQGAPVRKLGQATGATTGKIEYTNYDCKVIYGYVSDVIKDTIRFTNETLKGDSGGPVYFDGGNSNLFLIGMNFAGSDENSKETYGVGCKIFNVMDEFNITPIVSGTIFDTTDLANNEIRINKLNIRMSYISRLLTK